jgi:peptidoglycan/LPS O-acetylase OafA/YrhL
MGMIRTVLALAVVFTHSPWLKGYVFVGGRYAVQLFYIISGFLICHVLHRNPAYRDPLRFYASRALRLYPVYYVVLALSLVAVLGANRKFFDLYEKIPPSAAALLAVTNVTLLGQDWVLFSGVSEGKLVFEPEPFKGSGILLLNGLLVPQAWTLGVELSFYLVAPFLLRNRRLMLGILFLSLLLRVVLVVDGLGRKDPWTYRFFPPGARPLPCRRLLPTAPPPLLDPAGEPKSLALRRGDRPSCWFSSSTTS